jgi:membrane associated rhomboid family serine protease
MIIQEPTGTISTISALPRRWRRLRLSLLFATLGLALFVGSCAFTGTTMDIILLVVAGALGVASIVCTLVATNQISGKC